jgi:hypothetical protein
MSSFYALLERKAQKIIVHLASCLGLLDAAFSAHLRL